MNRYMTGILILAAALLVAQPSSTAAQDKAKDKAADKDDKKISITLLTELKQGDAPMPVHIVAEILADKDLDQYLYESSVEWVIDGSFVLKDAYSGGDPAPAEMRSNPMSTSEYSLRSQRHLVTKSRVKAPRKKFEPGTEVKRTYEFDYTFDRPGEYYVRFRLRNGKYSSPELKITVKGDSSYDPMRDPY